jgi:ribonucleotide monophosphatase NagD (HAD superfamily)
MRTSVGCALLALCALLACAAPAVAGDSDVLVVGDSLAADVGVAREMGWDSLLLLTGSARERDVPVDGPPTHVAADLEVVLRDLKA